MEYLVLIIIGIVIYLLFYRKSQTNREKFGHEEGHSQFQRDTEIKVNEVIRKVRTTSNKKRQTRKRREEEVYSTNVKCCAYLDIETTSIDPSDGDLTVVGLCLDDGNEYKIIQLVGDEISSSNLIRIMKGVEVIYTYNGTKFDLQYVKVKLGVDLTRYCIHKDLMYDCWSRSLYGGFKEVERKLGIKRKLTGIDGKKAAELGLKWILYGDKEALSTLLEYNREDVLNLRVLRQKLNI